MDINTSGSAGGAEAGPSSAGASKAGTHKACDECKRTKSKCVIQHDAEQGHPVCNRCRSLGRPSECTFNVPWRKRGPQPKEKRLRDEEQELNELRAALGALASRDQAVEQELAAVLRPETLSKVAKAAGMPRRKRRRGESISDGDPVASTSTAEWDVAPPPQSKRRASVAAASVALNVPSPSQMSLASLLTDTNDTNDSLKAGIAPASTTFFDDAAPRLPVSESSTSASSSRGDDKPDNERASGKVPERKARAPHLDLVNPGDRLHRWANMDTREAIASEAAGYSLETWPLTPYDIPPSHALPDSEVLERLLEAYWAFVHPYHPGVVRSLFDRRLATLRALRDSGDVAAWMRFHQSEDNISFLLMLYAMLAVSAVYLPSISHDVLPDTKGESRRRKHRLFSDDLFEQAMRLLAIDPFSRACGTRAKLWRCQALVLLGYREFGLGLLHSAYVLSGAAVRLAQDASFFVEASPSSWGSSADMGGGTTHEYVQTQKRIWHSCLKADNFMSLLRGRSATVRSSDFDCSLPAADGPEAPDEPRLWRPPREISIPHGDFHTELSITDRALATFNASASLSALTALVQTQMYPLPCTRLSTEASQLPHDELERMLGEWFDNLPRSLMPDLSDKSATLPHIIELHCQYCYALILLYRPRIRTEGPDDTSLEVCVRAAQQINQLIGFMRVHFGFSLASSCIMFWGYTAASIHLYTWTTGRTDGRLYEEMVAWILEYEKTWSGPALARALLGGTLRALARVKTNSRPQSPPPADVATEQDTSDKVMSSMIWHDESNTLTAGVSTAAAGAGALAEPSATDAALDFDELTNSLIASQWWSPWFAASAIDSMRTPLDPLSSL